MEIDDFWFQRNSATCHIAGETMQLLLGKFSDYIISHNSDTFFPLGVFEAKNIQE